MASKSSETEFLYHGFSPELTPIVPIKVFHESFETAIQVFAKVDTGFPGAFIMSETLGRKLKEIYGIHTTITDSLVAIGVFSVFCEIFPLVVKLPGGTWIKVNGFLPQGTDLGNVIGMELLRTVDMCFQGHENKLVITSADPE